MGIRSLIAVTAIAAALCVASSADAAMTSDAYGVRPVERTPAGNALIGNPDFNSGMDGTVYTPDLVDFDGMLFSDAFQTYTPFSGTAHTAFGTIAGSGYVVRTTTPWLLSSDFLTENARQYDLRDFHFSAPLIPGITVDAGYKTGMAGRFNGYDASGTRAFDGLFFSARAINSPYASLTSGGNFAGASLQLSDDLQLRFGTSSLTPGQSAFDMPGLSILARLEGSRAVLDQRYAQATAAGFTWNFAKWGGLGVTASQTVERNGLLGGIDSAALSAASSASTSAVGLSARLGFGDGWVTTVSYSEGITQLNLRANSIVSDADTLHSRAFGVAVAKHGLFSKGDSLGIALTRPIQIYSGGLDLLGPRQRMSLASDTPETDVELGYVTTFFDGALALQANAGYQMNLQGQSGTNSVTVLSRAKINF